MAKLSARLRSVTETKLHTEFRSTSGMAILRVALGLMWLYNVSWKRAPDFGQSSDSGLWKYTSYAVSHPVLEPYAWVVEQVVLPNFQVFGWAVLVVETLLAVLLLTGCLVRGAALVGLLQSVAIALAVAVAPNEWPWSYWLMIAAHTALLTDPRTQRWSIDGSRRVAIDPSRRALSTVVAGWGAVAFVTAILAAILAPADDAPALVGSTGLALALGSYGHAGIVALALTGIALIGSLWTASRVLRSLAGAVALGGAICIYAQAIDGNNTSAAFMLCLALVAALTSSVTGTTGSPTRDAERQTGF